MWALNLHQKCCEGGRLRGGGGGGAGETPIFFVKNYITLLNPSSVKNYLLLYIFTSSIYPELPSQYRLKSSSWPGSGSGRGCLSGGGGCLVMVVVVVVAPVSQWWWSVSPRVFLAKYHFLGGFF